MKRSTAQLGLSVPVLTNIIHAFPTVSHRARDLRKDSLAMRERVTHLMLNRCRGKHRKEEGMRVDRQWEKGWHSVFHTILVLIRLTTTAALFSVFLLGPSNQGHILGISLCFVCRSILQQICGFNFLFVSPLDFTSHNLVNVLFKQKASSKDDKGHSNKIIRLTDEG